MTVSASVSARRNRPSACERDVAIEPVFPHRASTTAAVTPAVLAGYAALPEATIREGVRRIGAALAAIDGPARGVPVI